MYWDNTTFSLVLLQLLLFFSIFLVRGQNESNQKLGLSLWIDEQQVKNFSGSPREIYAIRNGEVSPYILDPNFERYVPQIPADVSHVKFLWTSGGKKYTYNYTLRSYDETILSTPTISIRERGRVPKKKKEFSIQLPCIGNSSGIATFTIGLLIDTKKGRPLPGTPLRLKLRKECSQRSPDPECDKKCANRGWCNRDKICQCSEGYMGKYCTEALCYPQCMNGGNCTKPGMCSCPPGFQGRHCEGGICSDKCLNGGKCIQKDTCECPKGYYGRHCEYSRCSIACLNGGKCIGKNICKCPQGFHGQHCEVSETKQNGTNSQSGRGKNNRSACKLNCKHGTCENNVCQCETGWYGKLCHHSKGI